MTSANLRRTLTGCLLTLGAIAAFVLLVPSPDQGNAAEVLRYNLGLVAVMAVGVFGLVRLTFAVQHPPMPTLSGLPPRREDGLPTFAELVHDVLDDLPEALRDPIEDGRVTVAILSSSRAGEPYASFARIGRAGRGGRARLIVCRSALERDFPELPEEAHTRLADEVRTVLANRLHLRELGRFELDRLI
jgi:hypothetical protein